MHELTFCAEVKSWADALFATHTEWPFSHASVEEYVGGSQKRHDLRFYVHGRQTPVLCGEVKMPGTPEGRTPFDPFLMQDAYTKADQIQADYFFTWNVNHFVLFDRSKWNVQMVERRIKDWDLGLRLTSPADCKRPDVQARIRDRFLPDLFEQVASIVTGRIVEWGKPPDDIFLTSLESHLEWPVFGTRDFLAETAIKDSAFSSRLRTWMAADMNWTFDPDRPDSWQLALENAARSLCYVFCNRAIFYEALRAKYPHDLQPLAMPRAGKTAHSGIYRYFRSQFQQAMLVSGDYEPIFYPQVDDEWGALVFASDRSRQGWRGVFVNLAEYNFRKIPYDVIGGIFQKLIAPEERQKFGQYFTNEDIIDVINAFCIRKAGDEALDPACGSGSFLVRAYHRKAWLAQQKKGGRRHRDRSKSHEELLREIYGCDIALFAAHLATLNLAARDIKEEENYPYIARRNFFEIPDDRQTFCYVPGLHNPDGTRDQNPQPLPDLDAIIGNPPYVRQELIPRRKEIKRARNETKAAHGARLNTAKEHLQELCTRLWPGLKLSGRSDLHCYFWPVAAYFIREGGHFGFLTSSSWLDVEYGFALQGWILKNFKLIAVIESVDEPWFQDARIKTAITILQRCSDKQERDQNITRFVRLERPVAEILGHRPHGDETSRQNAAEKLRKLILKTTDKYATRQLRIIPIPQAQLWKEGVRAGEVIEKGTGSKSDEQPEKQQPPAEAEAMREIEEDYAAGKWGRFLRAPDIYFKLMDRFGNRFVRLGEIAEVRRGITSGCDAFFMPRDVTHDVLSDVAGDLAWNNIGLMTPCKLKELESGKVRIVRAGDGTLHPIEAEFLRPEVHSLMQVDRPVIRAKALNRVVLWVDQELTELSGTYVAKYIRWGSRHTFASKKSKAVTVPQRSSCASRPLWYNLTGIGIGSVFWPMTQKYRHIVPVNPDGLVCNHRLFYITAKTDDGEVAQLLPAVLNSTFVGIIKHFYGRYAGSEGTLDTEVIDCVLLDVPDPRAATSETTNLLMSALNAMCEREVTHLVDDAMLNCHSVKNMRDLLRNPPDLPPELLQEDRRELDDSVLQLLGVSNKQERQSLLDELYAETTAYYRYQRTQDIQAMVNRASQQRSRMTPHDLAASIWDSLDPSERDSPLADWIATQHKPVQQVEIPEGRAQLLGASDMFHPNDVIFKSAKTSKQVSFANPEQAALVAALALHGITGKLRVPQNSESCIACAREIEDRLRKSHECFELLAASRTGNETLQRKVLEVLIHWSIHGR